MKTIVLLAFVILIASAKVNLKNRHHRSPPAHGGPSQGQGQGGSQQNNPPPPQHHWGYDDTSSGAWAEGDCDANSRPSPVNLVVDENLEPQCVDNFWAELHPKDKEIQTNFVNNGHSIQMNGNWDQLQVTVEGKDVVYNAIQFHFHSPSEHTINGEHFDLEMHIVHKIDKDFEGQGYDPVAVAAFLFNESDDDNEFFVQSEGGVDPSHTCHQDQCPPQAVGGQKLNFDNFDFGFDDVLYYKGSFTTPPCTPIASWFVNPNPYEISQEQLNKFKSYWSQNARFAKNQDLNANPADWIGNNRPTQGDVTPEHFQTWCELEEDEEEEVEAVEQEEEEEEEEEEEF